MAESSTARDDNERSDKLNNAEETLGMELSRTARVWRAKLDERFRPLGLTQARWVVLFHLDRGCDGMTQKDLASEVGVEAPTLVRTLDLIEERKLIVRRPAQNDRRAKTVHLTGEGRQMLSDMHLAATALRSELLDGVSTEEMTTCLEVLTRVRQAAEKAPPMGHVNFENAEDRKATTE